MKDFVNAFNYRLAGALFCITIIAFSTMLLLFLSFQTSKTSAISKDIITQLQKIEKRELDAQSVSGIDNIKKITQKLPGELKSANVIKMIITAGFCLLFIMAGVGFLFHYWLLNPLARLNRHLSQTIKGDDRDLTIRMGLERDDEVGSLSNVFDEFISNLDDIIMNIGQKTETIAASSSEVSVVSERMDEESTNLHHQSNSVATAAEEMNTSMHTVAAASEEAATNIGIVADAAVQMQSNISGVASNCDQARKISSSAIKEVDEATRKVGTLGDAAKEITNVTQVITDIAEQTNLLALNATIEAARAGEAGKGFAVVANEIKSLAAQTGEATQSIQEKILSIQNSTQDTVDQVSSISQVIANVDGIINEITESIEEQSHTTSEVATNIEQASLGIAEVNQNVSQSSQVASEIAADISSVDSIAGGMSDRAANMAKGSAALDSLSMDLRKMIAIFRVSGRKHEKSFGKQSMEEIQDLMPWTAKLETSIPDIDQQHKELVRLVNLLHKAMKQQKGASEVGGILDDLAEYTVYHFGYEEKLFEKYGYPGYDEHKKIHTKLVEQVIGFQEEFKNGKATITMDLMDFLKDWLKNHIMKTDMTYVPFMVEKMS